MIELNKIYNENCLDTMARMPDGFVDLVVTSPPYNANIRIRNFNYVKKTKHDRFGMKYQEFDDAMMPDEYFEFHSKVIRECLRVCSGYVFWNIQMLSGNKRALFRLIGEFHDNLKEVLIWDKITAEPAISDGVMNSQFEFILVLCNDEKEAMVREFAKCNFKRGTISNVFRYGKNTKNKFPDINGAAFPVNLAGKIVSNFTNEGDVVYDPFMGTGTTAIVSHKLKRQYIGSEITKSCALVSDKRLQPHLAQFQIF